jgi:hypothetical protein
VEVLCGMTRDPDYGPLLAVGLGGAAAEAAGLVAVALAPLDLPGARALVARAPALSDLAGPAVLDALAVVVEAVGRLAVEHPRVAEVDVNPVVLTADGAVAVDALVVVEPGVAPPGVAAPSDVPPGVAAPGVAPNAFHPGPPPGDGPPPVDGPP